MRTQVGNPYFQEFILPLSGGADITIDRGDGEREELGTSPNLVTTVGMNFLAQYVSSYGIGTNSQMTHMAIGTGTTVASINQTVLTAERVRKAFSSVSVSANSWTATTTFGGGSDSITGAVITEVSVFNHPSSAQGVMWNRILLTTNTFTLQASDIATVRVWSAIGSR